MINTGRVISTAFRFIDEFTKPSKTAIDSLNKMANNIKKSAKEIQNAGKAISNVGSTMTKSITLPITGIATAAVKTAADFEASMSKVGAISGAVADDEISGIIKKAEEMGLSFKEGADTTETAINILKAKAQQMGATTAFSASESAEAMQYMAMAGWKTADMMDGIAGIMNLAAASGEDLAATSDIVTDGLTAFRMSAKESGRFADVMAAASSNANTNVALMGESFKYCASTAGAMGYSIEDISVAIGIMGNAGIKGSMAGTTLKNTIANLADPTDAQAKVMKKLGISLTDSNGNMKSFAEVMNNLRSSFSGLSETEQAAAATTLAGKQSMAGLLTIINASTKDFDKLTAAINGASGTAGKMAEKMLDNLNGQLTLLKSAIEGIAISIGSKLLPYVKKAVEWIQKVAEYINNLSDAQMDSILKWAGIAAAIGPAIMVFGKIVTAIGKAQKNLSGAIKLFTKFEGIAGIIKSPAGIVIGILAAIAIAAVLIIKNWDQVKEFLQGVGSWFKNTFEKAGISVEGFKNKFTSIRNTIGSIAEKISGFCKKIAGIFKNEFAGNISDGAAEAGGILETLVGGTVTAFDELVTTVDKGLQVFDALLSFFAGTFAGNWDNAAQGFRNSLKNIFPPDMAAGLTKAFDTALPIIKAVVSGIKAVFTGLVQDIKKIFQSITTIFKGVGEILKGIFSGDAKTALKGFETAAGGIVDTISNIFKAKINAIKNFVVNAFSAFLPEGVINKIANAFDIVVGAWDIAVSIAKSCISDFVQGIKPLIEDVRTIFKGIAQFVKGVFTGDWKGALNGLKTITNGALSSLINIIKAPFTLIVNTVKNVINAFKNMNLIKNIFTGLGNAIKRVLTKCGVDMNKFSVNISNIKTRIGNIINNLKTIFGIVFNKIGDMAKTVASVIVSIFNFIVGVIKKAMAVIVPVIKVAFSAVEGAISVAVQNISVIISGIMTVFDGITTFISGVFTGNWSKAWNGIKTIFKGVFDSLAALCKAPINAVIGIINGAISGINKLGLTIPDWVPFIGGKSFSINVPTIPMLYKGTGNWKGGTAIIHDRGGEIVDLPEGSRVYPHDKSIEMVRKEAEQRKPGSVSINIQKLADKIEVRSNEDIDRIVEVLAYKLKMIALNTGKA